MTLTIVVVAAGLGMVVMAHVMDDFGPPPPGDPSEHTGPLIGNRQAIDDLETLDPANEGAFDGGATGTADDAGQNGSIPQNQLNSDRQFDIPTGAAAASASTP